MILETEITNRIVGLEKRKRKERTYFLTDKVFIDIPEVELEKVIKKNIESNVKLRTDGKKIYSMLIPYNELEAITAAHKLQFSKLLSYQIPNYSLLYRPKEKNEQDNYITYEDGMFDNILDDTKQRAENSFRKWNHHLVCHNGDILVEDIPYFRLLKGQKEYRYQPLSYKNNNLFFPKKMNDYVFEINLRRFSIKLFEFYQLNKSSINMELAIKSKNDIKIKTVDFYEKLSEFFVGNKFVDYFGGVDIPVFYSTNINTKDLLVFFIEYIELKKEKSGWLIDETNFFGKSFHISGIQQMLDFYDDNYNGLVKENSFCELI